MSVGNLSRNDSAFDQTCANTMPKSAIMLIVLFPRGKCDASALVA